VQYITVRITSPPNGYAFPTSTPYGQDTDLIVLTAKVYDKTGAVVPNATIKWSYATVTPVSGDKPLATGNPLVVRLPAGQLLSKYTIRADATVRIGHLDQLTNRANSTLADKAATKLPVGVDPKKLLLPSLTTVKSYQLTAHDTIQVQTGTVP
jgi:hypothetical protein